MTEDLLLGLAGIAIGAGLVLGHRYIVRQWLETEREHLQKPLYRAMWEGSQRRSPRWMRGEGYARFVGTVWLLVTGGAIFYYGVKLVLRAV